MLILPWNIQFFANTFENLMFSRVRLTLLIFFRTTDVSKNTYVQHISEPVDEKKIGKPDVRIYKNTFNQWFGFVYVKWTV
jgi:hypothetical protein